MKNKRISWYQTGIISLIGLYFLGNMAIDKEIARTDLRVIQLNMPDLSRHEGLSTNFDLTTVDEVKKIPQIKISIDSLDLMTSSIRRIMRQKDDSHIISIFWNDSTRYEQIIGMLNILQKERQRRYAFIPNEKLLLVAFNFPKEEIFPICGTSLLTFDVVEYQRMQEESKKTTFQKFEDSYNLLFKNYLPMWLLFSILSICVIWKIRQY